MTQNLLAEETSPYLLQHADNPVHWRPWGPAALAEAKDRNVPVLLSVGYAACHWCHVMAHESFESDAIAAQMNELFVNVKVDREERPDIDQIYQRALQHLGQQGGWPLTMFLTPDGEPFWGGTYFPPDSRYGRPGFSEVLTAISGFYSDKQDRVAEAVTALRDALSGMAASSAGGGIPMDALDQAAIRMAGQFDMVHGGLGGAPKFPNPSIHELVWRGYLRNGEAAARDAILLALDKMSLGGIYDHLGGGYARYSTDEIWLAPHFEKMLYDNAQLIDLLRMAWQATQKPLYEVRIRETIDWIDREMISEGGGFAATLDADSEGEEGKFYVWQEAEIDAALGGDADLFKRAYQVNLAGNWEGKTILNRNHDAGPFSEEEEKTLLSCRHTLLDKRAERIRPGWDDKVLADWNGLQIAAMARAAITFDAPKWLETAKKAFHFVIDTMQDDAGRLYHSWRAGKRQHTATLDDYANMADGAIALFEATGDLTYIAAAEGWVAALDAHYWDGQGGGYFFTADDAEALIVRAKHAHDNATPAGNGVAAAVLAKLFFVTGKDDYRRRAESVIAAFSGEMAQNFFPLATLMNAAETLQQTAQVVIVAPDPVDNDLIRAAAAAPHPSKLIVPIAPDAALPDSHPAAGKTMIDDKPTAYICVGPVCSLPLTDAEAVRAELSHPRAA